MHNLIQFDIEQVRDSVVIDKVYEPETGEVYQIRNIQVGICEECPDKKPIYIPFKFSMADTLMAELYVDGQEVRPKKVVVTTWVPVEEPTVKEVK